MNKQTLQHSLSPLLASQLLGLCILISNYSFASNDVSYRNSLERVNESGAAISNAISRLGAGGSLGHSRNYGPKNATQKSDKLPLFKVHFIPNKLNLAKGKLLFGKVYTRLVVGNEESPVLVVLNEGQGALSRMRMMGKARQSSTYGRVQLDFHSLLYRSGRAVAIKATGLDREGAYGLKAEVFSKKAWLVAGALGSSFISGLAASQQTETTNAFGFKQTEKTGKNALWQGVGQTAADQSKRLIDDATKERPVFVVEDGESVSILVTGEN